MGSEKPAEAPEGQTGRAPAAPVLPAAAALQPLPVPGAPTGMVPPMRIPAQQSDNEFEEPADLQDTSDSFATEAPAEAPSAQRATGGEQAQRPVG